MTKKFSALIMLYAANVLDGGRTVDEVPEMIRADVQAALDSSKNDSGTDSSTTPAA